MKNISIDEFRALKNGNISTDKFKALNTEMNEQRKRRAEETLNNLMNPISNIAQSTISGMQNRPTMSDILNDFNSKRKVFEEEQKKQATNTLNNIANKGVNLLDLVGNTTNNIINDVRQSGAEDLSSYVQRKNQEQAVTNLKANPTSPLFDFKTYANEKIKQENRQNGKYKSLTNAINGTQTQYGNINIKRNGINWNKDNIEQYKDRLNDLNIDTNGLEGSMSNVLGSSRTYNTKSGDIEVAYSPLLETSNGLTPLYQDEIDNYITDVLDKAEKEYKKGKYKTLKDAVIDLDKNGIGTKDTNGNEIKGLIADIGDTARKTGSEMHDNYERIQNLEQQKIQQALDLQNNLRTEGTAGQKVGYTAGDVINNLTHSVTQEGTNLLKGLLYWQGDIANAFNNKDAANLMYKLAGTKDAASQYVYEPAQQELEKYSKLDDTARQVVQGLGQVATKAALSAGGNILAGGLGLTEQGTRLFNDIASNTGMFAGSMASARDEAISQGATQDQARIYGYLSGLSETASESMFGGFGKLTDAMGISRGIGGLDEKLSYGLRKNISNAFARNFVNLGVSAIGEGTEEIVSGLASALWKKLTYLPDEDLMKLIEDENLAEQFTIGALTSLIFQIPEYTSSSLNNVDMSTGQNVKEAVANEKIQQQYKNIMDKWKKENPEAYRMLKTSEEYFDNNPILKEGSLIESAEKYGYNPNTVEIQATQRMLDKAGIKVEFSDEINDPNIEGLWTVDNNGNRSIIINPYASKETIFQKVAVHELTHDILNKDIKEAESFKKDILDLISKEKSFTEAKTKIENLYKNITENGKPIYDLTTEEGKKKFNDIVEEELITNAMAEKFGVQEEINKLVSYKPSLARRIYDKVVEFFGKATGNEKLLWKNVQNKFERAFSQEGQFQPNEDRYSTTSQTDNQGRTLSKEQQEFFKDSKVRDDNGKLQVMYHTTPEKFTIFDKSKLGDNTNYNNTSFGFFVTPNKEFSERFGDIDKVGKDSNVMELYIDAKKPIIHPYNAHYKYEGNELDDIVRNYFKAVGEQEGLAELESYAEEEGETLYDTYMGLTIEEDPFEYAKDERKSLQKNGYDSVIFIEGNENNTINDNKGFEPVISYAVFDPNQIKNVDNTNPTNNPDIRYSVNLSNETQKNNLPTTDNQGNTIKPGMQQYMKESKARVNSKGQVDENGNLATVYHTTTDNVSQFNEFNPVGTPFYRFGDQTVNYFTDSKDMSGSYANNIYEMADTKRLNNIEDVNTWLNKQGGVLDNFELKQDKEGNYFISNNGSPFGTFYFNNENDLLRNLKQKFNEYRYNLGYRKSKIQYEGYVNITNPYIIDANGENWDTVSSRLSNTGEKLINILETIKKNKALNDIKTTLKDVEKNSYNIANEYAKTTSKMSFMANQLSDAIARTGDLESAKKQLKDLGWSKAEIENASKEKINNKSIIDIGLEYHNNKYDDLFSRAVENLKKKYKFLDNINDGQLDSLLDHNFDEKKIKERYSENNTTNDIVKQVIEMNKNGANYDGVIMKNVIDYGGKSETREPANLYVTFNSNQFKAKDNENPTEDPDIRYSIENDSLFNLEGEGTRTKLEKLRTLDFEDKRLTRQERKIMESWRDTNYLEREKKLTDLINNSNLPEERKTELIYNELTTNEDLDGIITEDILNKLENKITTIVNDFEKEYKEKQEEANRRIKEKQQEAKSWAIAKKEADTYDSKTYNLLERLEEKYPTNRNGKRTGKEWYDFANELGQELKKMGKTEQELDKIAKQTWYLYNPGQNRASSNKSAGYENNPVRVFNNSWVKAIKNGYESVNTILPTQAKIENKTIPIKEQQVISQNKEIEPRNNRVLVNPEDIQLEEQGQKGRKTLQSIIQSEQTDETTKELAKNMYKVDSYTPVSNVETLGEVNKQIRELGEDKLYNAFMGKMETGEKTTLKDIATGERLIQIYSKKGDYEKVNNLIREVAILGTELGQQVQALSLIRRATPEGQLRVLESLVNRANQKENTNVKITPEMTEKILNSKTQAELTNNIEDAKKELAKQLPLNFVEKTRSWRYLSMLGNPKTHIRNIFANIGMSGVQDVKNTLAGMVEDVYYTISKKEGERTKTLKFANKDQRNFAKQDAKEMLNLIDGGGKYEQKTTLESNKRAFDNKVLNKVAEFNTNALDKEDKIFLKWAYQKAMSNYMAANNLSSKQMTGETLQKARNYASKQAQEATFHQFSQLAKTLGTWQSKSKAANFLVSAIVPFKKTPINIAKTGFEYSPAGLIKTTGQAIRDMTKTRSDLRTQLANGDITQKQYDTAITEKINKGIDNLSKNLTGTALTVIGYALAKMGVIKAGNDDKEDEYEANEGKQTYSIQIGDYNFSLDWLAPSTVPLFMGAEIEKWVEDAQTEERDTWKNVSNFLDSASKMFEPMTDMSMIQGITSALKSFESGSPSLIATNLIAKPTSSYLGQYIPTALGQIAKSVDPYQRDTTSTQTGIPGVFDKAGKQALSKIPGLSQLLPTKVDVWGNKVKSQNYLQNAISPSTVKEYKETATDKELKRLYESTGTNVFPTTFSLTKYYKKDGKEYRLTPKEYNEMKTNYGQTSKNYIDKLIKSSDYKKMTDTQKAKAITEIYTYAKNSNKIRYMQGQGLTEDEKTNVKTIKSMINEGANPVDYFTYRGLTDGMKKESEKNEALLNANFDNTSKQTIYENNTGADDNFFKSFKNTNPNMDSYLDYKTQEFTSDKDSNGKTITNSRKKKVYNYIAQSGFDYPQRLMLTARDYKLQQSEKQYLVDYIVNLDISTEEMVEMLKNCGNNFEIKNDQVYFK